MFVKKLLPALLLFVATTQAAVFDKVAEDGNFEDFAQFLDANQGDVALESNYVSIAVDLLKVQETSAAAWMRLLSCLAEVMHNADDKELVIQNIADFIRSSEFDEIHGEIGVYIGLDECADIVDDTVEDDSDGLGVGPAA